MRVFIGVDPRDIVSFHVLRWSIERRATKPVSVTGLILPQLPITRQGLTHFTYSRYAVPALCGFRGKALFLDSDMLCLGNIAELFDIEFEESVAVVKSKERFEWPSLMLFNCDECTNLSIQYINDETTKPQEFEWAKGIADLPPEWNHCVGYDEPSDDAKLVHYTMGTPGFKERRNCEYSEEWRAELENMNSQASILEIHGRSVHMPKILQEMGLGD